jgi:hypothetical protein
VVSQVAELRGHERQSGTSPRVQNSAGSISLTVPSIRDHEVIAVDFVR